VREYLKEKGVTQEFTYAATQEENSYIDTFHRIIQREVIERLQFESIHHDKAVFYKYNEWYNQKRKNVSPGRIYPEEYLMSRG
jgi:putative transposase